MAVASFTANASGAVGPQPANGFARLMGWQITETGGVTNLTLTITETTGGKVVAEIVVQKGTSAPDAWFGPQGIKIEGGCTVSVSGGTSASNLFIE